MKYDFKQISNFYTIMPDFGKSDSRFGYFSYLCKSVKSVVGFLYTTDATDYTD